MNKKFFKRFIDKVSHNYKNIRLNKDRYAVVLARPLYKLGIHPNTITTTGFGFALVSIYYLFNNHTLFVVFFLLNFLADFVDGTLARISKIDNPYGKYIDATCDALYGVLILVKSYLHFRNPLILIPLVVYIVEAVRIKNWAPGFYPNIFWLKFFFLFKLFKLGIVIQFSVSVFNITMRKIYSLKYDPKG